MIGFFLKKNIFDGWDHFGGLFLCNAGFLFLLAACGFLWYQWSVGTISFAAMMLLVNCVLLIISLYSLGVNGFMYGASSQENKADKMFCFHKAKGAYKNNLKHFPMHFFLMAIVFNGMAYAVPFYYSMGGFIGGFLALLVIFMMIFVLLGLQYHFPLCMYKTDMGIIESVKISFAYAIDNLGWSLFLLFKTAFDLVISIPFVGIVPGAGAVSLSNMNMTRILFQRYTIAEKNRIDKTFVYWNDALESDRLRYEKRTFKSLLFPGR